MHAGFALRRIEPEDARANLDLIRRALATPSHATRADRQGDAPSEDEP
jgi:hydrogenase maturation factor